MPTYDLPGNTRFGGNESSFAHSQIESSVFPFLPAAASTWEGANSIMT